MPIPQADHFSRLFVAIISRLLRVGVHLTEEEARAEGARIAEVIVRDCVTHCFPAGTLVATTHGAQPIERVRVGDQVLTENTKTGKVEAETVQAVHHDPPTWVMAIGLADGSTIEVTPEHPFWVDRGVYFVGPGWLQAGDLRVGDQLRTASGGEATVVALRYR
ncbi:MAG: Hint domain-containing protein, partial [Chloroflexota bacterium]